MNESRSLANLMNMKGRVVAITGGAGHLGGIMGDAVAELGATVIVIDQHQDRGSIVCAELSRRWGGRAVAYSVDLAKEKELRQLPTQIRDEFGRLDVLVNCAALVGTSGLKGWAVPFAQQDSETWRLALEVNLTAPFVLTQACLPLLNEMRGNVINIGSIYGLVGPDWSLYEGTSLGNPAAYAASKGGLAQFTRWMATSLAPRIRANCIVPGGIWRQQSPAFVERYVRKVPLGRMAKEEDFKGAVAFLASDLSNYVTGQEIVVDGGFSVW